jgi:hypothetical protein
MVRKGAVFAVINFPGAPTLTPPWIRSGVWRIW